MDRTEEDMKFVGFFGIFNQSVKTIFKWKKIFAQITLTLILPLTIIFLAHKEISHHFFYKINDDSLLAFATETHRTATTSDWLCYWLFTLAYFTFLTLFSLLSTAAVVFTIASVYTDREVVFRQVLKVVPKIWKKLFVTFAFIYCALFIYNVVTSAIRVVIRSLIFGYSNLSIVLMYIILILYVCGFLYLSVVWQLASVITVLENLHGFKAMKKGKHLLNGKKMVGMGIAFVLYTVLIGLITVCSLFVVYGDENFNLAMIWRVMIGILTGLLIMMVFLMMIVTQTVLYLVCKSYHREAIDKLSLSTFLGAYMGETVVYPKPGEEIQLGRPQAPPPPLQQV